MNSEYILPKLLKLAELFYGVQNRKHCFSKKKDGLYHFGWKKKKKGVSNAITKEVAMYLCIGKIKKKKK